MQAWPVVLFGLSACNQVLGNTEVGLVDARDGRLLKPPPARACPPPPDFSTWKLAPRAYGGVNGAVIHPTFLDDDTPLFGYQGVMYSGTLEGTPAPLVGLDDQTGAMLMNAAAAPGGDVFWYTRYANLGGGLYYATRDAGAWTPHTADFSVIAYSVQVGAAAFYAGEIRMVIALQRHTGDRFDLAELASSDGLVWQDRGVLSISHTGVDDFDPALSVDGCVLLFSRAQATIYAAFRQPDGTFGDAQPFPGTSLIHDANQPALSPNEQLVWFASSDGAFQATP